MKKVIPEGRNFCGDVYRYPKNWLKEREYLLTAEIVEDDTVKLCRHDADLLPLVDNGLIDLNDVFRAIDEMEKEETKWRG